MEERNNKINSISLNERITALESSVQKEFEVKTMLLLDVFHGALDELARALGTEITGANALTGRNIQRLNAVYAGILSEMEKRTIESLYSEALLIDMEQEAALLFREEKYLQASVLYLTLSESQPENINARFFYLYSLFLSNKMDRGNYPKIKEGLTSLERGGYLRAEIHEVMRFMELEESGYIAEETN